MKVYLVTEGDHSDYHVCCVCSTLDKARRAKAIYAADDIEELELDKWPEVPKGKLRYSVVMDKEGNTAGASHISAEGAWNMEEILPVPCFRKSSYRFTMFARDEKHAVKIANDRRAQMIANNQWESCQ